MTTFATTFREIVAPRLHKMCALKGFYVAHGWQSFSDGYLDIMVHARRAGALHLPPDVLLHLEEWLTTTLMREADKHFDAAAEASVRSDRIARDIQRYFEEWSRCQATT